MIHCTFLIQTTESIPWYSKENGITFCIKKSGRNLKLAAYPILLNFVVEQPITITRSLPRRYLKTRNQATIHCTFLILTTKTIQWYNKENGMAICIKKSGRNWLISRTPKFCHGAAGKSQHAGIKAQIKHTCIV